MKEQLIGVSGIVGSITMNVIEWQAINQLLTGIVSILTIVWLLKQITHKQKKGKK